MSSMQKVTMRKRTIPAVRSALALARRRPRPLGLRLLERRRQSRSTLVAYSTPQGAYESLIPAFQATTEGKGVTFSQSYGPSGDQSRAVANGLHADVVNFSLEPDVDTARQGRARLAELEPERHARLRHQLGRGDHRAQGQPQAHHRLVRPGQAGRAGGHAQPVHLGQRALEHHGRVRRAAQGRQDPGAGRGLPAQRCSTTSSARTARRATRCRRSSPGAATR